MIVKGRRERKKNTGHVPRLPFADINFSDNPNLATITVDLLSQVVIDEFLVGGSESEP